MFKLPITFSSPVVLSVSILTAIGAYVLFGPEPKDRRKRGYPGGLVNYGNNCFANAIVQCLAASSIFIQWLEQNLENNQLAQILHDLIQSINGQTITYSDDSTVATLVDRMRQPRWLNPYEQQDSHEFFVALINCLTNSSQITPTKHFGFAACLDNDETEPLMVTQSPLITPHPFQGLQATQLQCMACRHKNPVSLSLFETLSLIIPDRQISNGSLHPIRQQRNFTLQELIGNYLNSEMISHLTCSNCKATEDILHKKVTTFSRLPEILCLHIIRTTWTNEGWPVKNTSHVSFPDQLDMNPYISLSRLLSSNRANSKPSSAIYRLNSVLVHLGGISEAGHFIIYRRRTNNQQWLSISDESIRDCSELQVFSSMAYILFYERIKK